MSLPSVVSRLPASAEAEPSLRRAILETLRSQGDEPSSLTLDDDPAVCFAPPPVGGQPDGTAASDGSQDDLFRAHGWEL